MQDLNQILAEAEDKVVRLAMQAKQENAMADVLPLRFAKNIASMKQHLPNVAKTFESYVPKRSFRFFCNENGIPNIEWLDTNIAMYGEDPYAECEKQINSILSSRTLAHINYGVETNVAKFIHVDYMNKLAQCFQRAETQLDPINNIPDSLPLIMMFGVGLGYQLTYLYQHCRASNLFIFEPDLDLFYASLFCFEWAPLLDYIKDEGLGIHLFLGTDEEYIIEDLLTVLHARGAYMAIQSLPCWHYPSTDIFKMIDRVRREFHILAMGWGFFDDNVIALSHCAANLTNQVPFLLKNKQVSPEFQELPVFIVANGPSLDSSIEYIKRYRDNVLLISCGSTLSALFKAGIKPDVHVETERTKATPDSISLIDNSDYLKDIFFFSTDVIHPDTMNFFSRFGLCFKAEEPSSLLSYYYFPESRKWQRLFGVNPTVSNIGLTFACIMGFQNIYLFGMDCGYKEQNYHHSRLSIYFDEQGQDLEDATALIVSSKDPIVPGNFGGEVRAPFIFNASRRVLEMTLRMNPDVRCMNCSDGAAIAGTIPLHPAEIKLDDTLVINKLALLDHIYHDHFSPINIIVQNMYDCLDIPFLNLLVDRMINEWDTPFYSRHEVADCISKQYGYLNEVNNSMQRHIYKMLIGSMNYVFALVNTFLYRYEDEDRTLEIVREAIVIIQNYLQHIKNIYPKALESVDQTNDSVIEIFRKGSHK